MKITLKINERTLKRFPWIVTHTTGVYNSIYLPVYLNSWFKIIFILGVCAHVVTLLCLCYACVCISPLPLSVSLSLSLYCVSVCVFVFVCVCVCRLERNFRSWISSSTELERGSDHFCCSLWSNLSSLSFRAVLLS